MSFAIELRDHFKAGRSTICHVTLMTDSMMPMQAHQNLNTPESTSEFSRLLAEWFSLPRWKNHEMVKPNSRFLVRRFVCVTWRTGAKETVSLEYLSS